MNLDEYYILFHKNNLNLVAFKRVVECSEEILSLVNAAMDAEREWVGLTDEEKQQAYFKIDSWNTCVSFIEALLKGKNT